MRRELEIQFLEISIRTWLNQMDEIFYRIHEEDADFANGEFSHKEIQKELSRGFVFFADRVYNSCLVYLELKGLHNYSETFQKNYSDLISIESNKSLSDLVYADLYINAESKVTKIVRQLLYPFRAFASKDEEHLTGLDYLENILRSTTLILIDKNIHPKQESEVYNGVKVVLEATFPKSHAQYRGGHNPFNQLAKCYKPDILLPALNCAVEYKFATTIEELSKTIDEILIDVQGYSGNPLYNIFYAVFYVKSGITTEMRFAQIWDSKAFPENWKPIYVEGPTFKTVRKNQPK